MFKKITSILLLVASLFVFSCVLTKAQGSSSGSVSASPLENQAQVVKIKQASEAEIQTLVTNIKAEDETLNTDILNLKNQETELQSQITNLNKNLKDFKTQSIDKNPNLTDEINQTKQDLDQAQKDLLEVKNDLAAKQAKLDANQKTLDEAQANLVEKTKEVKQEVNTLQQQLLTFGSQFLTYLSLILSYWLFWQILRIINKRFVRNKVIGTVISFSSTLLALIATLLTLLIAFIGNLALLITSFGVFSAALVVALQDFVSSFFAWILIGFSRIYRVGDTISITTGKGVVTGTVTSIGLFRTGFKEKMGGLDVDKEMSTGKILSFPNNLVLKESLTNSTRDNNVIWHSFNLVITFESDHRRAREILENICKEQFQYAVDHEQQYFAGTYNIKQYKPRVYMNIAADGPSFTIWFATKIGFFRERLEKYSESILDAFQKEGIELAYSTSRVVLPEKNYEVDPETRSF
jgi:small-conductance mechanosensitive channel